MGVLASETFSCASFLLSLQSPGRVASVSGENQAASQRGFCLPAVDSSHPAVQQSSTESPQQCHAVWKQSCCLHEAQVVSKQSSGAPQAQNKGCTAACVGELVATAVVQASTPGSSFVGLPTGMLSHVLFLSCLKGNQKSTCE